MSTRLTTHVQGRQVRDPEQFELRMEVGDDADQWVDQFLKREHRATAHATEVRSRSGHRWPRESHWSLALTRAPQQDLQLSGAHLCEQRVLLSVTVLWPIGVCE